MPTSTPRCRPGLRVHQDGGRLEQVAELKGSDTVAGDHFGDSVAISGTTAVVGATPRRDRPGLRVHQDGGPLGAGWRAEGLWHCCLEVPRSRGSHLGHAAIVGSWGAGRAYVFTKTADSWAQVAELKGSDTVARDMFGQSVAISGTTAIVSGWGHSKATGRTYLFEA